MEEGGLFRLQRWGSRLAGDEDSVAVVGVDRQVRSELVCEPGQHARQHVIRDGGHDGSNVLGQPSGVKSPSQVAPEEEAREPEGHCHQDEQQDAVQIDLPEQRTRKVRVPHRRGAASW